MTVGTNVDNTFDEELWYGASPQDDEEAEAKAAKSLSVQVGSILGARPFPATAQRLSAITRDPACKMPAVVEVLESDPALSARLLRLVNSAGFALRTACTTVGHAATLVGIEKLNQVATTAAILDMYDGSSEAAANILEHVTIVGGLARYLGSHFGLPADELFTCGFLHDIGKLMLLDCEGESYVDILEMAADQPDIAHLKERELFGYDHAVLAGQVLSAWNIPDPIPKVVAWHHQPTRGYEEPLIGRMIAVLRLADSMSYALFRPFPEHEIERLARTEAASYMEISEAQLANMWVELYALAEKSRAGFRGVEPSLDLSRFDDLFEHHVPHQPKSASLSTPTKLPENFPCVVCGVPSYANQCPACYGYVCPRHQLGTDAWCARCVEEYGALQLTFPKWVYLSTAIATLGMVVFSIIGAAGAVTGGALKALIAPGLLASFVAVVVGSWHRWLQRVWFLRRAPRYDRAPPIVTDETAEGAATSLAPPASKQLVNPFEGAAPRVKRPRFYSEPPPNLNASWPPKPLPPGSLPPPPAEPSLGAAELPPSPAEPSLDSQVEDELLPASQGGGVGVSSRDLGPTGVYTSAPPPPRAESGPDDIEDLEDFDTFEVDGPAAMKDEVEPTAPALTASQSEETQEETPPLEVEPNTPPPVELAPPSASPSFGGQEPVTFETPRAWQAIDGSHGSTDGW